MGSDSLVFCDPGICDDCMYVGDGDFLCAQTLEIVVEDWIPTDAYVHCQHAAQ